jgi:DNA-binding response OmpR family regulator
VRPRLLLVEDDTKVARSIGKGLREEGYQVDVAESARAAEELLAPQPAGRAAGEDGGYDLLILDWMLPDGDGLVVARRCRARAATMPILFLTAKDAISDRVTALDAGADDYLVKPFAFDELLARVRALLRRSQGKVAAVRIADVEIDLLARTVRRAGQPVTLTAREFAVLAYLARHLGRPVSRPELLEQVWAAGGEISVTANVVDAVITKLRSKLESLGAPPLISTLFRVGYMLGERGPEGKDDEKADGKDGGKDDDKKDGKADARNEAEPDGRPAPRAR